MNNSPAHAHHPGSALFDQQSLPPTIPAVDHYAGNLKFITKALGLQESLPAGTMDVTLDLEDGAVRGKEAELLAEYIKLLNSPSTSPLYTGVRVHEPSSRIFESEVQTLIAECKDKFRYLTIPKPHDYAEARFAVNVVERASEKAGLNTPPKIHFLIETHRAVHEVWDIAGLPHLEGLDFGLMDFVSSFGGALSSKCMRSPEQFSHALLHQAKTAICAAAHAHSLIPVHNVTVDVQSPESAANDATRALQEFGFLRMWSIHPLQIEAIAQAFRPSPEVLIEATTVLQAGQQADWGPSRVDNQLHDRASYRYYWYVLRRAYAQGVSIPEGAKEWFGAGE